jgi:hypothetical protein
MRRPRWLAVLPLLAVLSACGADGSADPGSNRATEPSEPAPAAVAYPGTVPLSATAIRTTLTGVAIDVDLPAGGPGCGGQPRVRVADAKADLVRVTASVPTSGAPECIEHEPATLTVDLDLRGRDLSMNTELWELGTGTSFVRCGGLGCDPPRDRCDPAYTHEIGADVEIPPERYVDVLACDSPWLVADVDAVVTGCQSVDGSTPPASCEVYSRRWFAHLDDGYWHVVGSGTAGGCTEVLAQVPDFPRRLCTDLPPLT